jgi:DNA-binding response OmpR family regulator
MQKNKILIIDDDPVIVKLASVVLKARNYDVVSASNGDDGLTMVKSENPDLILLDISMPTISGYEVCQRLKTDKYTEKIPIIMLTSEDYTEAVERAFKVKADDYIVKPINLSILVKKIDKLITNKHKN